MLLSALLLALREIRRNLMRSFLTVLGIVIGVAAVITMVTLGNGAAWTVPSAARFAPGQPVLVSVRPEQMRLADEAGIEVGRTSTIGDPSERVHEKRKSRAFPPGSSNLRLSEAHAPEIPRTEAQASS